MTGGTADGTEWDSEVEQGGRRVLILCRSGFADVVFAGQSAIFQKSFLVAFISSGELVGAFVFWDGQVEVAPVDADIVAVAAEDRLRLSADAGEVETLKGGPGGDDGLGAVIGGEGACGVEVEGDLVRLAIAGPGLPAEIRDRAAEGGEVLRQSGFEEGEGKLDASAGEGDDGAGGGETAG